MIVIMRRQLLWAVAFLFCAGEMADIGARPSRESEVSLYGPSFPVGDLTFTIPFKWQIQMVDSPARGGQWRVPPIHGQGESGQVVAFYFGPGIGGTAKENIEAWIGTMFNSGGHPAAAEVKHHNLGPYKISQVVVFGTYNQIISMPGIPPEPKSNYGLLGAIIENPDGNNVYWRFTGPEPLITASLPLFNKMIDSVQAQPAPKATP